jgi:hypothetical protein
MTLEVITELQVFKPHIEYGTCIRSNDRYDGHNNREEEQTPEYIGKIPYIQNHQGKPTYE